MPARVTYWTGTWDPAKEAISKEIDVLRTGSRQRAPVVAISPANRTRLSMATRALTLSPGWWPALRLAAALVEPRGDVSHIFGGPGSWHLVRALGRRPILFTAVAAEGRIDRLPHLRFARVVVESEISIAAWVDGGVPRNRVAIVRPGVDLSRFHPRQPPSGSRFTLLFASTPAEPAEIEPRGIHLLIGLARARADVDIFVPWRMWGDVGQARRAIAALDPPSNFRLEIGDVDMQTSFARAHATIVCFAPGVGKTSPLFVVEGLAAGLPCICTPECGLAPVVGRHGAGVVTDRDVGALSRAVSVLQAGIEDYRQRARALAEAEFDLQHFRSRYDELYAELLDEAPGR